MGNSSEIIRPKSSLRPSWAFGFTASILGAFLHAVYFYLSKHLMVCDADVRFHPFWLSTLRQAMTLLLSAPHVAFSRSPYFQFSRRVWLLIVLRAIFGLAALVLAQLAIQRILLTDFATILAITPVVTSVAAWPILGERLKITDIPAVLACVAGVLYIVKPDYRTNPESVPDLIGCLFAFGVVLFQSGLFMIFRKLKAVPFSSVTFIFSLLTMPVLIGVCAATGTLMWPPCSLSMRVLSYLVGATSALAIILQIVASQTLKAKILSLSHPAELVFQFILQIAIPSPAQPTAITASALTGAALVTGAFVYLAMRSVIASQYHRWSTHKVSPVNLTKI